MRKQQRIFAWLISCSLAFVCSLGFTATASASVDAFHITNYTIDYQLSRDAEQRSILTTTETITAEFPDFDQNHGIERAIPHTYLGHPTSLQVTSVTKADGQNWNYSTYGQDDYKVLRIGDADRYVHGMQTYKITYTQRDVTNFFADTNATEFYWDTNGTEWRVPIDYLQVHVSVADELKSAIDPAKLACYRGLAGSADKCAITPDATGYSVSEQNLLSYENVTVALGFTPNTFAAFKKSTLQKVLEAWSMLFMVTMYFSVAIVLWLITKTIRASRRSKEITVITPEYIPPKNISVSTASTVSRTYGKVFAAQLIDLAVRHYLRIYQTKEKSLFKQADYELEIIKDISTLKKEEQELLKDIFESTSVGSRLSLASLRRNTAISRRLLDNSGKLKKSIEGEYALRAKDPAVTASFTRTASWLAFAGVLTLSPWILGTAILSYVIGRVIKPLTDAGLDLVRYLKGLEMYIKAAEVDRLQMLQSPSGAAKQHAPIDTNDNRQLIKLYERVLPYAILFGQEKEWNKQLAVQYETTGSAPTWYHGLHGFNAASFGSALNNFSSVATYASPTSSSSGGSSGGGFSGGGGGGGGGGGW